MKHLILSVLLLIPILTFASADPRLPEDVATFIETRDGCDHFRGEVPYDEARRKFLAENMRALCAGTDKALKSLKSKYRRQPKIIEKLNQYEDSIELNSD